MGTSILKGISSLRKLAPLIFLISMTAMGQQFPGAVAIGSSSPANSKSILDVNSTTRGVLLPRMTTTQQNAITSPTEGLIVYDKVLHQLSIYDGSAWQQMFDAGNLTGTIPPGSVPTATTGALGIVFAKNATTHNFITGITSGTGAITVAQPAFTDISGTASAAQLPNPTSSTLGGVESLAAVTHQFINSISTSGVPTQAQPACADLSNAANSCSTTAASTNTVSNIVLRDGSGNFSAGTITAALTGNASTSTSTSQLQGFAIATTSPSGTQVLGWNSTTNQWNPAVGGGGGGTWGSITGTLSAQTDLQSNLNLKAPLASPTFTGVVTAPSFVGALTGNATTVTTNANLTGNVTSVGNNTTIAAGVVTNSMLAGSIDLTAKVTGALPIANGGTGQTAQTAAFDALSPLAFTGDMLAFVSGHNARVATTSGSIGQPYVSGGGTAPNGFLLLAELGGGTNHSTYTKGDILYASAANTLSILGIGSTNQVLAVTSGLPAWKTSPAVPTAPTTTVLTSTGTQTGWLFTVSAWTGTIAVGDTYTNNGNTYTVQGAQTNGTGQTLFMSGTGATSLTTLTKGVSAAGPATITFSTKVATATYTTPANVLYLAIKLVGGGGGGAGSGTTSTGGSASAGTATIFGANLLLGNGGGGGVSPFTGVGGAGGSASVGTASGIPFIGGAGSCGTDSSVSFNAGGNGGVSPFGGAGVTQPANTSSPTANSGSGGGGAGMTTTAGFGGCGGGAGGFVDAEVVPTAGQTFPYIVGAAGGNGAAGTSGIAGSPGSTGSITIRERYQ